MRGFRFRRSIRLAKGFKINLTKSGTSLSVGRRGSSLNFGPKGEKGTVGMPGTGMSYSRMLRRDPPDQTPHGPRYDPNGQSSNSRRMVGWTVIILLIPVVIYGIYIGS